MTPESQSETIERLTTRIATLERLLQSGASPEVSASDTVSHDALRAYRDSVRHSIDASHTCAVVSRGDDQLLLLAGRAGWHFPRADDGSYLGYHPGDDESAIAHLEYVRSCGADALLLPRTQMWWLDHYRGFASHLERNYEMAVDDAHCRAYSLINRRSNSSDPKDELAAAIRRVEEDRGDVPSVLDLTNTGFDLGLPLTAPDECAGLPFEAASVDFVVVAADQPQLIAEARRIAGEAVCLLAEGRIGIEWQSKTTLRQPSVSVVIPSYNGLRYLRPCLKALSETVPAHLQVEIIVADDCSDDGTAAWVDDWRRADERVRLERATRNRGFIDTCNGAAATASGDLLLFLNNDTVPLDGWLTAILRTFRRVPEAGAVGGKLIFPDGRLQEAGNVMFKDASGANFGKWDPKPSGPLYSYLRDADYCSGALLATPRDLFAELDGFDTRFRPAYYEDADYCFQVRRHGLRVLYQPESRIVHVEGGTSGTDLQAGPKRAQVRNRKVFAQKWKSDLSGRPSAPKQYDIVAWYELAYGQGAA